MASTIFFWHIHAKLVASKFLPEAVVRKVRSFQQAQQELVCLVEREVVVVGKRNGGEAMVAFHTWEMTL